MPLKRDQIKKIKALYYTNQGLFNIIGLIKFLIWPLLRGQGRNLGNFFVAILGQTIISQGHSEIIWPLVDTKIRASDKDLPVIKLKQ